MSGFFQIWDLPPIDGNYYDVENDEHACRFAGKAQFSNIILLVLVAPPSSEAGYEKEMETFFEANPGFKSHLVSAIVFLRPKWWTSATKKPWESPRAEQQEGVSQNRHRLYGDTNLERPSRGICSPSLVDEWVNSSHSVL